MTSSLADPGPYDAIEKARPDEPIFALLGRDFAAPAAITEWARIRRNRAIKLYEGSRKSRDKELLAAELKQCAEAEAVALTMEEWRKEEAAPEGNGRASYSELVKTAEELAEVEHRKRRAAAIQHLSEAAYHVNEANAILAELELAGEATQSDLKMMVARIIGIQDEHTVKRASIVAEPGLPLAAGRVEP